LQQNLKTIIEIHNLSVSYGKFCHKIPVLQNLCIDLYQGETLALVGQSGTGKSTVARSILNILPLSGNVDNGEVVFWDGPNPIVISGIKKNIKEFTSVQNKLSIVFQDPQSIYSPIHPICSLFLDSIISKLNIGYKDGLQVAIKLLSEVGIHDGIKKLHSYPHQISLGTLHRIALAISLIANPQVLICDEITAGQDAIMQSTILSLLRNIQNRTGMAILFISHDIRVVKQFAHRVAILESGRITSHIEAKSFCWSNY